MNPIDDGLGLAAYISDVTYWSYAGTQATAQGFWNDSLHTITMNALFLGVMPTAPTANFAGLAANRASRTKISYSLSGGGYARAPLPASAWAPSTGGTTTNIQPITFPTATGPWKFSTSGDGAGALVLYSALTGGNILAQIDMVPTEISDGMTFTIPAGTVSITTSAPTSQGSLAPIVHNLVNDFWLRGQTFSPLTIYLALSTAPANIASPPIEPAGGGYARVATTTSSWSAIPNANFALRGATNSTAVIKNAAILTFPAPTGNWGTVRSVYLMDSPVGGNVLGAANLTIPRTISAGEVARSFATGALWISKS
jgi:hypothetical protein